MVTTTPKNDAEAQAMRDGLAKFERDKAQAEFDANVKALQPLADLVATPEYGKVLDAVTAMQADFRGFPQVDAHLQYLPGALANLRNGLQALTTPPPVLAVADARPAE